MMTDAELEAAVRAAGELWDQPEQAEALLLKTLASSPESEVVLVALYRFYFYRNEFNKASVLAERCIHMAALALGVDPDWQRLATCQQDFADYDLPQHRFYLFSLNAYGYLQARLGKTDACEAVLSLVKRLDPKDRVGAGRLLDVFRAGPDVD